MRFMLTAFTTCFLFLNSCASKSQVPEATTRDVTNTTVTPSTAQTVKKPNTIVKDTASGVNKTINGVNRIGNTIRNVNVIRGLFH